MSRIIASLSFFLFYVKEVVTSNVRVAYDVLTPTHRMKPGVIELSIAGMTDTQVLAMANLITMTPGTLGLHVSEDKQRLFLHVMYLDKSPQETAAELEASYGKRVRDVF
ncbi:MAG: Na+/H+ antiporter subunit E [Opitutales bacterium]|nr:Na+/H+ antiporter subunit E [Opitutales bacterium]NRA25738.1 Na+/H+ antiporter subunit E [Opitutales bacterium]